MVKEAQVYAYVGLKPCGCAVAASVIAPGMKAHNAKFAAEMIRAGLQIEQRTVEWCRKNLLKCPHKDNAELVAREASRG